MEIEVSVEWEMVHAGRWRTKDKRFVAIRADVPRSVSRRTWRVVDYDTGKYIDVASPDLKTAKQSVERFLSHPRRKVGA